MIWSYLLYSYQGTRRSEVTSKRARVEDIIVQNEAVDKDMLAISRILEKRREIQTAQNNVLDVSYANIP